MLELKNTDVGVPSGLTELGPRLSPQDFRLFAGHHVLTGVDFENRPSDYVLICGENYDERIVPGYRRLVHFELDGKTYTAVSTASLHGYDVGCGLELDYIVETDHPVRNTFSPCNVLGHNGFDVFDEDFDLYNQNISFVNATGTALPVLVIGIRLEDRCCCVDGEQYEWGDDFCEWVAKFNPEHLEVQNEPGSERFFGALGPQTGGGRL